MQNIRNTKRINQRRENKQFRINDQNSNSNSNSKLYFHNYIQYIHQNQNITKKHSTAKTQESYEGEGWKAEGGL